MGLVSSVSCTEFFWDSRITFEIDETFGRALDLNGLVVGLVALEFRAGTGAVADKALLAFQHQDGPAKRMEKMKKTNKQPNIYIF